jgi:GDP-D-mannose dehydratase
MSNKFNVEQIPHVEHPNSPFIYNQHTTQQHTCESIVEDRFSMIEIKVDNIGTEIININNMLNDIYNRCNQIIETQKNIVDINNHCNEIMETQKNIVNMNNIIIQKLAEFDCEKSDVHSEALSEAHSET